MVLDGGAVRIFIISVAAWSKKSSKFTFGYGITVGKK